MANLSWLPDWLQFNQLKYMEFVVHIVIFEAAFCIFSIYFW